MNSVRSIQLSNSSIASNGDPSLDGSESSTSSNPSSLLEQQVVTLQDSTNALNIVSLEIPIPRRESILTTQPDFRRRSSSVIANFQIPEHGLPPKTKESRMHNLHASAFLRLPAEIFMLIFEHLNPEDLLLIGCVCYYLKHITDDDETWRIAMHARHSSSSELKAMPLRDFYRRRVLFDYKLSTGTYKIITLRGHVYRANRLQLDAACVASYSKKDSSLFLWKARSGHSQMQLTHIGTRL